MKHKAWFPRTKACMICSKLRNKVSSIIVEDENKKDDKEDSENDENKEKPTMILEDEKQENDNEDGGKD